MIEAHRPVNSRAGSRRPGWLFAGCLLLFLALGRPVPAQWEGQNVVQVTFDGLTTYKPEQIAPRLKTQPGKPYKGLDVRDDLDELAKIMRTATVFAEPAGEQGVNVRFAVREFPRLRKLQIVGNLKLKTERAETLATVKEGDTLGEQTRQQIENSLRNEYKALGMPQARVTLNLIDVPEGESKPGEAPLADLQIMIDEGRQILCEDVILQGNEAFAAVRLKSHLNTKGSWGFLKNYYDDRTFEEDLTILRDFYAGHGYFDARVERGEFRERTVKGKETISPAIRIAEGERYKFGVARVRGARLFPQAEVLAPFKALEGRLFDGREFGAALKKVQDMYLNHGLLTTEINPQYEYDAAGRTLNVTIDITERNRIYVGKIKLERPPLAPEDETGWFRGWYSRVAPPVGDEAIAREVLLAPGDVYNKQLENDTLRRLSRLGVLEDEKLRAYNEPTADEGVHNLVLHVEDAVTGALSAGVGFGDATGAFVFGQFSERNLGGRADVLSLNATLGTQSSSLVLTHLNRHFKDTDNSLESKLYIQQLSRPGYRASVAGGTVELGHPLEGDWRAYVRGRIEAVKLSERDGIDAREELDRVYGVATARLALQEDTRAPFGNRPREGYFQEYALETGYAGGPLVKLEGTRDQYWGLSERLTYRMQTIGGLMPYDRSLVPIHERFFLGGASDLRGFSYRGAGPMDEDDDEVPLGGAAKLLVRNELMFPVYDPVSGVLFADVGSLGETPVSWEVPRVSTGVGLRFDLKRVQVALDLAAPIVSQPDDDTHFFHFSLQSEF